MFKRSKFLEKLRYRYYRYYRYYRPEARTLWSINLISGIFLYFKLLSDLTQAYFGNIAYTLTQGQAFLTVKLFLEPWNWSATSQGNVIYFPEGKMIVSMECMAAEILGVLIILVFCLARNFRELRQGIFCCPFMFWLCNSVRIAILAICRIQYPHLFPLVHSLFFDLAMSLVAVICLIFWLNFSRSFAQTKQAWLYRLFLLLPLTLFVYSTLQLMENYGHSIYQKSILLFLHQLYSFPFEELNWPHLSSLLSMSHMSGLIAFLLLSPGLKISTRLLLLASIFILRLGCDLYFCQQMIQLYHIEMTTTYSASILLQKTRVFFQVTSFALVAIFSLQGWRTLEQNPKSKSSLEKLWFAKKEFLLLAWIPFFLTPFSNLEEIFWLELIFLTLWMLSCQFRKVLFFPLRLYFSSLAILTVVLVALLGKLSPIAYEERACFHFIQQEYSEAVLNLNAILKQDLEPENQVKILIQKALLQIVLGKKEEALLDIKEALKMPGKAEMVSPFFDLWYHLLPSKKGEVILREKVWLLFAEEIRLNWEEEYSGIKKERYLRWKKAENKESKPPILWNLAIFHFQEKDYIASLENLNQLAVQSPSSLVYHYRGLLYLCHRHNENALRDFQLSLYHNPKNILALTELIYIFLQEKNYGQAEKTALKALSLSPYNKKALEAIWLCLKNDFTPSEEEKENWRKALEKAFHRNKTENFLSDVISPIRSFLDTP